jgi:hypothetical protein
MGKMSEGGERGGSNGTRVVGVKSEVRASWSPLYSCLYTRFLCNEGSQHIFLFVLVFRGASTQES